MMKTFNTTAVCVPSKHYMVNLTERVNEIKKLVDAGKYFTINRARQYGKTTTINALIDILKDNYTVIKLSFERLTNANFHTEQAFVKAFCRLFKKNPVLFNNIPEEIKKQFNEYITSSRDVLMDELFLTLGEWCATSEKPIVLIIDEVDSASNNQVFLGFLGLLRDDYINKDSDNLPAFQSVILAGVTDIKHLKAKIREDEDAKENSPWNIATDFNIDMSLSEDGIKGMLDDYESDHNTGMDTAYIAKLLRDYTNGYPFLVSRLCQLIDERVSKTMDINKAWTLEGFDEAVKLILAEDNTLFQSLTKNLNNYPDLKAAIRSILMDGTRLTWNAQQQSISQLQMYGLIQNDHNTVRVANRIFEVMLYNLFLSDEEIKSNVFSKAGYLCKNQFVEDNTLNVRLILQKFIETYTEVFGKLEDKFKEKDGREHFLLYLKPIINGTGNYYIEAQTRDMTRTDVIIDYLGKQYIIELKIWHGDRYNEKGEKQLSEYLDYFGLNVGYMLSFNFNKKKETGVKQVHIGDKLLYEGIL
ncbi:MAG: AAA-like domain-containing protein [Lachnospiraceae bacterium]|nr:AAA-like domain-containing protein [Lachnospiraceae bacterium]